MTDRDQPTKNDPDDIGYNESANPSFETLLAARLSRRNFLLGSVGTGAMAVFGGVSLGALAGCNSDSDAAVAPTVPANNETLLGFTPVAKSLADAVVIPDGYSWSVLCALGDPLSAGLAAYANNGTDSDFENRFGDHHDGMEYFGLSAAGTPDPSSSDRALIGLNHEATTGKLPSFFLYTDGGTNSLPRPAVEVDKEMAIHGVAVFEIAKSGGTFAYVQGSPFNFRIHQNTDVEIHGPARGNALMVTKYSTAGTATRGTLNNCGTGETPWGTLVTGEENWNGYFTRAATDDTVRNDKTVAALNRYGSKAGVASRHGWESVVNGADAERYRRWDISLAGASTDGSDDYRNELNTFGYLVEVDPYGKAARPARKRTALGRFAHEAASFSVPVAGQPLAVYQGDDSRGEYIYKFVSAVNWDAADAMPADRLATGDKYLNEGKLYVAKFNADGSGEWIELSITNAAIAGYATYTFADQADVLVNARLAADAVGATKMDRPEWSAVNPVNGEVYFTLTNNSKRGTDFPADPANPRVYTDTKGTSTSSGNVNGHIVRIRENAGGAAATSFTWDVYLFGAEAGAGSAINLSGLTDDQDFSSPDGLAFTPSTGICWIQTDDGAYTDVSNCMMVAALPGQVGDGESLAVDTGVTTYRGKLPTANTLKRFLVGPKGSEITGICESPDGRALFVNIQHPGEKTLRTDLANPDLYQSQWPANAGYGAGQRPRSATIVITKNDGGRIGS